MGLAVYPVVLEPFFGVTLQSRMWAVAYFTFVVGLAICGFVTWRFGTGPDRDPGASDGMGPQPAPPPPRQRIRWIALAFVPASLSLAITTHITNQVAPIPLLWTLPLGIYLLTFIIAFSRRPILTPERIGRVLPFTILPLVLLVVFGPALSAIFNVALNLIALFFIGLTCHGELSASRPAARYLTGFYLLLSIGGALGGVFNALIAPYVFHTVAEYPLTLVLACAILPTLGVVGGQKRDRFFDVAAPVLLGTALLLLYAVTARTSGVSLFLQIGFSVAVVVCFGFVGRRLRFALGIGTLFLVTAILPNWLESQHVEYRIYVARDFFGTKFVIDDPRSDGTNSFTAARSTG